MSPTISLDNLVTDVEKLDANGKNWEMFYGRFYPDGTQCEREYISKTREIRKRAAQQWCLPQSKYGASDEEGSVGTEQAGSDESERDAPGGSHSGSTTSSEWLKSRSRDPDMSAGPLEEGLDGNWNVMIWTWKTLLVT
ncbi:hypothetical protein F5887DRAFT_921571 [Amanita rubescens]|nr:hypothetical protein F5887DRAFT_921571 [Amanita rubescens]